MSLFIYSKHFIPSTSCGLHYRPLKDLVIIEQLDGCDCFHTIFHKRLPISKIFNICSKVQFNMFNRIVIKSVVFVMVMLLPRQLGLLAVETNIKTQRLARSTFWKLYSILWIGSFIIVYPCAIHTILSNKKMLSENNTHGIVETVTQFAMYLFSVMIYIQTLFSTSSHIKYNNFAFEMLDKCKKLCPTNRESSYTLRFIIRVFYSYFGYIILNIITSYGIMQTVSFVYVCIYFLPDIISVVTLIRVATIIAILDLSFHRINCAFKNCMKIAKKYPKTILRLKMGSYATFIQITEYHYKVYELTREIERLTTNLVVFSILNVFVQIVSMVNNI